MEDRYGVVIRDALYDQLAGYFDLDRNGTIYSASFCAYLYDTTLRKLNFFKVNPGVLTNQICEYIKNCLGGPCSDLTDQPLDQLQKLESELKSEIQSAGSESVNIGTQGEAPLDLLLTERINAKLF